MAISTLRLGQNRPSGFVYRDYHRFEVIVNFNSFPDIGEGSYCYYLHGYYLNGDCLNDDCLVYRDCLYCFYDVEKALNTKCMLEKLLASLALGMDPDSVLDEITEDFPDLDVRGLLAKLGYVPGEGVSV